VNIGVELHDKYLNRINEYATKILPLNQNSAYGHFLSATVAFFAYDANLQQAVRKIKKALEINPRDLDSLLTLGSFYGYAGKPQAARSIVKNLLEIDPLTPINHYLPGWFELLDGRLTNALELWRKWYQMAPDTPITIFHYALILAYNDQVNEACGLLEQIDKAAGRTVYAPLASFLKQSLQYSGATAFKPPDEYLTISASRDPLYSWMIAIGYALADEKKAALHWLEIAVQRDFINYPFFSEHDPFLENIRNEPRFRKLMERVKDEWENFEV
ncbi:hypothetical protein MJD09_02775, partial [bacterium]|nr:hypothetical protein [bacterium]